MTMTKPTLYFATTNKNKIKEVNRFIGDKYNIVTITDLGIVDDVEETGKTYRENAALKAHHLHNLGYSPVIAEDSGVELDALYGNPGIYSKRAYPQPNDVDAMEALIRDMNKSHVNSPYATYSTTFVGIFDGEEYAHKSDVRGHIADTLRGENGYMYDKVFCPQRIETQLFMGDKPVQNDDRTYAEMSLQERDQFNARKEALMGLLEQVSVSLELDDLSDLDELRTH